MSLRSKIEIALLVFAIVLALMFFPYVLLLNRYARRDNFLLTYIKAHVPFFILFIFNIVTPSMFHGVQLVLTASAVTYFGVLWYFALEYGNY